MISTLFVDYSKYSCYLKGTSQCNWYRARMEPKDYCNIITGQNECFLLLLLLMSVSCCCCCCCCCCFQTIGYLEGKLPVSNCRVS